MKKFGSWRNGSASHEVVCGTPHLKWTLFSGCLDDECIKESNPFTTEGQSFGGLDSVSKCSAVGWVMCL